MERDIKSAVDYLFRLVSTSLDVPEDAMRFGDGCAAEWGLS